MAFSPDGRWLATACDDGTARLRRVYPTPQALVDAAKARAARCLTQAQRREYFLPAAPPLWCVEPPACGPTTPTPGKLGCPRTKPGSPPAAPALSRQCRRPSERHDEPAPPHLAPISARTIMLTSLYTLTTGAVNLCQVFLVIR